MLVRMAREAGTILAELAPLIVAECARPVSGGQGASGTTYGVNVYVGDEFISKNRDVARGKVTLTLNDDVSFAGRAIRPDLVEIANLSPAFEAHLWTPADRQDRNDPLSGAQRINAHLTLVECIVRAIFGRHHGAVAPAAPPATRLLLGREIEALRHGQAAVLTFPMALAIYEGQPLQVLPTGSTIGTVGVSGSLIVNPEDP